MHAYENVHIKKSENCQYWQVLMTKKSSGGNDIGFNLYGKHYGDLLKNNQNRNRTLI